MQRRLLMDDVEHYSWCAHVQNMARPRSMRLIGPRCECAEHRRKTQEWKERVDSGEFDEALGITNGRDPK